jgi:succinoglycan biosynthesis transport protein ExoP
MTQNHSPEAASPDEAPSRSLNDYFRWFLRRFWIFVITLVGGYLLGLYMYSITPATYQSFATIEILRVKRDAADIAEDEKIRMSGAAEMLSASERLRLPQIYIEAAKTQLFANRENLIPLQRDFPWTEQKEFSSNDLTPEMIGAMLGKWVTVRWRTDTALLDLYASHTDATLARDSLVSVIDAYESLSENRVAGSSEYVLDYIMDSSNEIKERLLKLDSALRLYQRCSELNKEVEDAGRQVAEMEKRYLPKWPALVEAKELQRILREQFSSEVEQVIRISEEERAFWEERLAALGTLTPEQLIDAKMQIVSTRASVLQRDLDAEKQIYDNLILQLKEGNVTRGFASRQFEVVQPPTLPGFPAGPVKSKMIIQYAGTGAALGIGLIMLLGFLDPTARTVSELEQLSGVPVIAAMPAFKKRDTRKETLELLNDGDSQTSEALRTLRAGLTFLGTMEERCTFLVTSSIPGEGKSWVASNLALSFAIQGDRTLLIDADLRRPVQSEVFGYDKEAKGLSDQLSLGASLKDIILRTEASENLFIIPAGSRSANPSELLSSKSLRPLIEKLTEYFDRIVIDSAPLIPVSDTIPIAKLAQSTVLVTRMGKTPKGAVKRSIRILSDNAAPPVGIVANAMPKTRTAGSHGYYYSYTSGGSYSSYSRNKE